MAAGHGTPTPLGVRSFLVGQYPLFPWVQLCLDSRLDQLPPAQQEGFQDGRGLTVVEVLARDFSLGGAFSSL